MFDEFDILRKEISNDFFKLECVIETEEMRDHIFAMDEVLVESEGESSISEKISALKEKIVETFKKIIEKFKEAINKLFSKTREEDLKAKLESLKKEAEDLIEECKKDPALAKEVNDALDDLEGVRIEDLDPKSVIKYTTSIADKFTAWVRTAEAKISNGEVVTAEEIAKAKAYGDAPAFKMPLVSKIGFKIAGITTRIMSLIAQVEFIFAVKNNNVKSMFSSLGVTIVYEALNRGVKKLQSMEKDDTKNISENRKKWITENELISSATSVANAAAYVESKLRGIEADAYATQIRILTSEIGRLKAIIEMSQRKVNAAAKEQSSEEE